MEVFPITREPEPRPQRHLYPDIVSTSHRRLGLISWYTSGFQ